MRIPNKLVVPYVLYIMPRNPPFCIFASFSIVSLACFINKPDSSRDLAIFSVEIVNVAVPGPRSF